MRACRLTGGIATSRTECLGKRSLVIRKKTLTFSLRKASEYIGGVVADSPFGLVEPPHFGQPPSFAACRSMVRGRTRTWNSCHLSAGYRCALAHIKAQSRISEKTMYSTDSTTSNSNQPPCRQSSGDVAASSHHRTGRSSESGLFER